MVDIKQIYLQLDKEFAAEEGDKQMTRLIQRACLPLVMRALALYNEQVNEDPKAPS